MKNNVLICFIISWVLLAFVGCGRNCPVRGKVTFSDNGSPLTQGTIVFDNGKENGRAEINPDGSFVAGLQKPGNGLTKGTWNVSILGAETRVEAKAVKQPLGGLSIPMTPESIILLIDEKYKRPETSGLSVTVDGSVSEFELKVDRPKK